MGSSDVERKGIVLARGAGCALAPSGRCFRPKGLRSRAYGLRLGQSTENLEFDSPNSSLFVREVLCESELSHRTSHTKKSGTIIS